MGTPGAFDYLHAAQNEIMYTPAPGVPIFAVSRVSPFSDSVNCPLSRRAVHRSRVCTSRLETSPMVDSVAVIVERVLAQLVDRVVIQELVAEIDAVLVRGRRLEEEGRRLEEEGRMRR